MKAGRLPLSYAGVNSIGLRRRGFVNEKINEIQDIYRILFQSGLNNSDAVERIEAEMPASKERDEIIMFVRNSKRGVMKGYMGKKSKALKYLFWNPVPVWPGSVCLFLTVEIRM